MPSPDKMIQVLNEAAQLFRATPGRCGTLIQLGESCSEVMVVGDLHGNIDHFRHILIQAQLDKNPGRHLVLQELVHGQGRYENGGCKSHQLVDVVAALKCQFPEQVHLILGNHELSEIEQRPIIKAGEHQNVTFWKGIEVAYGARVSDVHRAYLELFRSLPLAVRTANGVFISHSIPNKSNLDGSFDVGLFETQSIKDLPGTRGTPLYALVWGRDVSTETAERFARLVDARLLITGHIPCPDGFETPNPIQLILDSAHPPAAYVIIPNCAELSHSDLVGRVKMFGLE